MERFVFQRLTLGGDLVAREPITLSTMAMVGSMALTAAGTIAGMTASASSARQQEQAALMQRQAQTRAFEAESRAHELELESIQAQQKAAEAELQIGAAAQQAANFRADQLMLKSQEERATASAKAGQTRKQKELALSKLRARAASSGGGVDDPTIVALGEGIEKEGELAALTEFYTGEASARSFAMSAIGERMTGNAEMIGATGRYEGRLAAGKGAVAQAEGNYLRAKAGNAMADANLMKNFAGASATRRSAVASGLEGGASLFEKYARYSAPRGGKSPFEDPYG